MPDLNYKAKLRVRHFNLNLLDTKVTVFQVPYYFY